MARESVLADHDSDHRIRIVSREEGISAKEFTYAEEMLWKHGKMIPAIKSFRDRTGYGIKDCKDKFEVTYGQSGELAK